MSNERKVMVAGSGTRFVESVNENARGKMAAMESHCGICMELMFEPTGTISSDMCAK
jgi:hypothetical protein